MTDRSTDPELEPTDDEEREQGDSILERAKDKLADAVDAPEGADYDESATNPVTGQPRR